jgi:hypothetical protein
MMIIAAIVIVVMIVSVVVAVVIVVVAVLVVFLAMVIFLVVVVLVVVVIVVAEIVVAIVVQVGLDMAVANVLGGGGCLPKAALRNYLLSVLSLFNSELNFSDTIAPKNCGMTLSVRVW